jgi:hypothetical protein
MANKRSEYHKEWREKNKDKNNAIDKAWYEANKERCSVKKKIYNQKNKEKTRLYNKQRRENNYKIYYEFMQDKKCNRCNYSDYRALVWHHIDPKTKKSDISEIVRGGRPWSTILLEISKCECLCQNCHHIEHHPHTQKNPPQVPRMG